MAKDVRSAVGRGKIYASITDTIGDTPLVYLDQYHNGTGGQAAQRAFDNRHTVVNGEARVAEIRQVLHVFQAFGAAEARLGKWQVGGDAQYNGVGHIVGLGVELAYR